MARSPYPFLDHPGFIAFAHRGGGLEAAENTWTAFRQARDLGYRYIETDVHATADGIVVTIHDPDLTRTSERSGLVQDMPWSELASIRLIGSDDPVPRLEEALGSWPDLRWNIDAKDDRVVGPLIETIHRSGAIDRVCISSFNDRRLARIRRALGPRLCAGMGSASTVSLRMASVIPGRAGHAMASRVGSFAAAQVPLRQGRIPVVDHRFVATAHRLGVQVHVWTVDEPSTMESLIDLGVDGIMTDRPTELKTVLTRRGLWA